MILLLLSFVRTIVPAIVGAVVSYLTVTVGLTLDPEFEGALGAVLFATFTGLYYLIVRVVEMKFPIVGVLLGYAKSPDSYSKGPGVEITKPEGNEILVSINADSNTPEPTLIPGTTLPNLNSSVVNNLDRVDGPDHRAE